MIRQGDVPLAPGFPPSANTHEGGSFCIETGRGCRSCLRGPLQLPSCTAELVCLFWQPLHHTCEWRGRYAKWRGAGFLSETAKSTRVKHSHLCSTLRGTPHPRCCNGKIHGPLPVRTPSSLILKHITVTSKTNKQAAFT